MLDESDMVILNEMRKNARVSYSTLARKLGLSETAVRKRVEKLLKEGVISRFTVETNLGFRAIIFASVEPKHSCGEVARKILELKGVEKVYEISGEYDLAIFLSTKSYTDANRTIDAVRSLNGIKSTYTVAILGVHY